MKAVININGQDKEVSFKPHEYLLDVLRRYGYSSLRRGCETTSCSVCTVLMDDKPVHSCAIFAARAEGHKITTVEGVKAEAEKVAKLLMDEGADQCGYCSPGFVMTVIGMKNELKNPTDEEIKDYFMGNLCRCTGYVGQLTAIKSYLEVE
jgi:aerobic carbon-monoxide dehydrogenase small subunit